MIQLWDVSSAQHVHKDISVYIYLTTDLAGSGQWMYWIPDDGLYGRNTRIWLNKRAINYYIATCSKTATIVNLKNCVFWDVTPCGSCKNRRFGGT
jgi:hypothetical protein